ncbi:hypothetical protein LJR118_002143 [Acidovorax sp. LjRoot118]|uniref:HD domain-containing protein n=1 Tax=Acidovorax sp. LjRoot118 TaxID=3342256 RepID=UPI003ECC5578
MTTVDEWILTSEGTEQPISGFKLLMCKAPRIEVIAHSLAQINRYTGHASRPYSVAEHSLLVADIVASMGLDHHAQRLALMHDAHESLCGDASTPVKVAVGTAWMEFEHPLALLVRTTYHLKAPYAAHGKAVRHADLLALATERRDLMRFDPKVNTPWSVIDQPGARVRPLDGIDLNTPVREAMIWRHHRDAFLARYHDLEARCKAMPGSATA